MGNKLVVTGEESGKSVFSVVADIEETVTSSGARIARLWGTDKPLSLPTTGIPDDYKPTLEHSDAPPGALRVSVIEFPEDGSKPPGRPFSTPTVDVIIPIEGEITIGVDDGVEETLRVGDVLIQQGARHYWRRGSKRAKFVAIIVGATREG